MTTTTALIAAALLTWPEPTEEMKPWVYNWWMGSAVDAPGLEYQCKELEAKGFGGFHVIPIYGAKGGYERKWRTLLSDEWIDSWNLAVRTARRHGLGVDLTMGSGWCFGGPWVTTNDAASSGMKVKRAGPGGQGFMIDPFSAQAMSNHVAQFAAAFGKGGRAERPRAFYHDSYEYYGARPKHGESIEGGMLECFRVWTDWCRANGYLTRNEAHGSPAGWLDLYMLADIPETEMFGKGNRDILVSKFASSAAHAKGTTLVSAESCTWIDEHFHERPAEIKRFIDRLFLAGVNHVFYHGFCYSPVDAVWPGWCFYASCEMNPRNPIWREMGAVNAYLTRCQSLFQTWTPDNDLQLVFRQDFGGEQMSVHNSGKWFYTNPAGQRAKDMWERGYQFDYITERMTPRSSGEPRPSPFNLRANGLMSTRWRKDGRTMYFVVNPGEMAKTVRAENAFTVMNPLDGAICAVREWTLHGGHSAFLVFEDAGVVRVTDAPPAEAGRPLAVTQWTLTPVCGGPALPPATNLTTLVSWSSWDDAFSGTMRYEARFDAADAAAARCLDLGEVHEIARVRLNGRDLGVRFMPPYAFDLPPGLLKATGNALEVEVTSLGANRVRWNDRTGVNWKYFTDANMLSSDYRRLDASKWAVVPCGLLGPVTVRSDADAPSDLESGFDRPPNSAKPHTWYHMMNGNVTKEGITCDFEALAAAGFGGVQMFDAGCAIPRGGLDFNSPEWFEMFRHAAAEARRLGLEICIPNCSGWSSSGGPWNPPSNAMKRVVFTETHVHGPSRFHGKLPRERNDNGYYDDIAILAFPLPPAERADRVFPVPHVETPLDAPPDVAARLADGRRDAVLRLERGDKDRNVVTLHYPEPVTAAGIVFQLAGGDNWGDCVRPVVEVSADGKRFEEIARRTVVLTESGSRDESIRTFPFDRTATFRTVRVRFEFFRGGRISEFRLGELALSSHRRLTDVAAKTFAIRHPIVPDTGSVAPDQLVGKDQVRVLARRLGESDTLDWEVPPGEWVIQRIGVICNGRRNHPASDCGVGLEVDKLSAAAMDYHFDQYVTRLCRTLGPLAGHVSSGFNNILVDSYEVGSQNWTQGLDREFARRCGYDLTPYLPVFAGRIVGSLAETERFLEDFRRVVADLFAVNYAGRLAEKCHEHGLLCSIEPYGNCPADNLQYGQYADIPMGEFWSQALRPYTAGDGNSKFVSSVTHVWGKRYCATESFTASPGPLAGRWMTTPFSIKSQGDLAFSDGVNRLIYHRFTHQPWPGDRYLPGMTMGRWGMHLDRTQTWWPYAKPFFRYQTRSQYMLQRGTFVADVLFFAGEEAPNQGGNTDGRARADTPYAVPEGYDRDICPTDALKALRVENGELVVPGGVRYRLLVLPAVEAMSPPLLRTVARLQREGARIAWTKRPVRAPGLAFGDKGDAEVRRLADAIFAAGVLELPTGEALARLGVAPQITWNAKELPKDVRRVNWIHRRETGAEWFFVAMPTREPAEAELSFRVSGLEPELWNPESGVRTPAAVWREEGGRTIVRVPFDVSGATFVVFRRPAPAAHLTAVTVRACPAPPAPPPKPGELVVLRAIYGAGGKSADVTARLNRMLATHAIDEVLGNSLMGGDPAPMQPKKLDLTYVYRGETNATLISEWSRLTLPPGCIRRIEPLPLEFVPGADGAPRAWAWRTLEATLADSSGASRTVAAKVPVPQSVEGPWEVSFPNGFAPNALAKGPEEKVTFDRLQSWSERPEEGVRYFSGSATYRRRLTVPANAPKGSRLVLDLGEVREVAEVTVNGRTYDPLWRPPFRLDVTDAMKDGTIDLSVRVANLWANRLIGDDRTCAPDCEWQGKVVRGVKEIGIRRIPDWVKAGRPSPTGRHTFTTWKHWDKDDDLLPSGLIGPVRLRVVVEAR